MKKIFLLILFPLLLLSAVNVTVNGSSYSIPQTNERGWGNAVTSWIQAISSNTLQPSGGSFTLTSDVDFGASYGLKTSYLSTRSSNPSSAGLIRLNVTDYIGWRNNANNGNLLLAVDGSDRLTFNGSVLMTSGAASLVDNVTFINDNSDATKQIAFDAGGTTGTKTTLTAAQTANRVVTFPDASTTLVGTDTTQTLTNKTLTSPVISSISNTGTLTLPTSTDTLVGRATTDTLTNKTLTAPVISTISNTGTLTLPTATTTLVGRDTTDTLTNKTISYASNTLTGVQPTSTLTTKGDIYVATASATVARQGIGSDGQILVADSSQTNGLKWSTISGGVNYISNPGAESATTGWATYADAAGTQPVDCTGGSPNTTWTRSTSSPMHGSAQFLATLSTGATRQGEGISYDFSVDSGDKAKVMQVEFDYQNTGGTFVAGNDSDRTSAGDSTFSIWIYDVTNATLIQPTTYRLYSNSSLGTKFVSNFQTASNSTSYRLCIHKGTTTTVSGSNITEAFDDFKIAPTNYVYGTPISDWVSYTPTGSWSNVTYTGKWRRVGDSMEVNSQVTLLGTPTTATLTVSLPSGYSIDTAKLANSTIYDAGLGNTHIRDFSGNFYSGSVRYNNSTSVLFTSDGGGLVTQAAPMTWDAADQLTARFSVPITGWSSSTQISDGYDGRSIVLVVDKTAGTHTSNGSMQDVASWNTPRKDSTASFNATTGVFTAPSSGDYKVHGNLTFATSSTGIRVLRVILNSTTKYEISAVPTATDVASLPFSVTVDGVKAGDSIKIQAYQSSGGNLNYGATTAQNTLSIEKLQSPQTMSATEVVAARYTTAAAQSIPNTTTNTIIDFGTKVYDTHNAVTTGASWKFTAPIAGLYKTCAFIHYSSANAWTAGNAVYATIFKSTVAWATIDDFPVMASVTDAIPIKGCTTVQMNAGDYIDLETAHNRTGGSAALTNSGLLNYIEIERIK